MAPTFGISPGGDFGTQISSPRIGEWLESLLLAALVDVKPQKPETRLGFRCGCFAGLRGCRAGRGR